MSSPSFHSESEDQSKSVEFDINNQANETASASPKKRRRWPMIVAGIVLVLGCFAAFNMYREAEAVEKIAKRLEGIPQPDRDFKSITYTDPTLGYTIQLPRGWEAVHRPDKPVIFIGYSINNSTPNLQVGEDSFPGELDAYVSASLLPMKAVFKEYKLIDQSTLTGNAGLKFTRCVTEHNNTKPMRQIYYYAKKRDQLFVIICASISATLGNEYDSIFDSCVQSLKLKP